MTTAPGLPQTVALNNSYQIAQITDHKKTQVQLTRMCETLHHITS